MYSNTIFAYLAAFHTFIIISCTPFYTRRLRDRLTRRCDSLFLALDTIQELPSLYLFYSMNVFYLYCSYGKTLIKTVLEMFLLSGINNSLIYPYIWCWCLNCWMIKRSWNSLLSPFKMNLFPLKINMLTKYIFYVVIC